MDEMPQAVDKLNAETRRRNRDGAEYRAYDRARSKVTLPDYSAWLNKKVPE